MIIWRDETGNDNDAAQDDPEASPVWQPEGGIRGLLVQQAYLAVGHGYPHPDAGRLLYPNDPPALAKQAAKEQSSCALTALALWRTVGVDHPALEDPYLDWAGPARIGNAVSLVESIARAHEAWVDCALYRDELGLPEPGDAVLVGHNTDPKFGGPEHVFNVTRVETDGRGIIFHSVEGGLPGIEPRSRLAHAAGTVLRFDKLTGTPGRRARGWVDAERLHLRPWSTPYEGA